MAVVKLVYKKTEGYFNTSGYSDGVYQIGSEFYWYEPLSGISTFLGNLPGYTISGCADVNGDGVDDVLLSSDNDTVAWIMGENGPTAWHSLAWNEPSRKAVGGMERGKGNTDAVLLVDDKYKYVAACFGNGSVSYVTGMDPSWTYKAIGDMNGDGVSDIIFGDTYGQVITAYMNADMSVASWGVLGYCDQSSYEIYGTLKGAGNDDVLLRSKRDNTLIRWGIQDGAVVSWNTFAAEHEDFDFLFTAPESVPVVLGGNFAYTVRGALTFDPISTVNKCNDLAAGEIVTAVGDFTRTGHESLLTYNTASGMICIRMGSEVRYLGSVDGYEAIDAADYNGDGRDDVILREKSTGVTVAWIMGASGPVEWHGIDWGRKVVGFGNADNAGGEDAYLVDENAHYIAIASASGQYYVGSYDGKNLRVAGVGDVNNDKISDIIFAGDDGNAYAWLMDANRQISGTMTMGNFQEPGEQTLYVCGVLESGNGADLLVFDQEDGEFGRAKFDHGAFETVSDNVFECDMPNCNKYSNLTDFTVADFGSGAGLVALDLNTNGITMKKSDQADTVHGYIYAGDWAILGGGDNKLLLKYSDGAAGVWHSDGSVAYFGCPEGYTVVDYADVGGSAEKDIILHNKATGEFAGWIMGDAYPVDWKWITSSYGASYVGCEDYNGDGKDDLFIAYDKSIYVIDSESRGILGSIYLPEQTELLDLADVNGDNHADLILRHDSRMSGGDTGYLSYIDMYNGSGLIDVTELGGNVYRAAADVDGDNKKELLLTCARNNHVITVDC